MAYKHTVAIIGATTPQGSLIAQRIGAQFRLLLMDTAQAPLMDLQNTVLSAYPQAEVDLLTCCKDASWEADIVVVAIAETELAEIAARIKEVTTCKPVIHLVTTPAAASQLVHLLPHANVVTVELSQPITDAQVNIDAVIQSKNEAAIRTTKDLLAAIGVGSPGPDSHR